MKKQNWYLYIVKCQDGTLYTGITNDLNQRIRDHNRGKGCRYTRYRRPVELLYVESFQDKSLSLKREIQLKGLSRSKKIMLIEGKLEKSSL